MLFRKNNIGSSSGPKAAPALPALPAARSFPHSQPPPRRREGPAGGRAARGAATRLPARRRAELPGGEEPSEAAAHPAPTPPAGA